MQFDLPDPACPRTSININILVDGLFLRQPENGVGGAQDKMLSDLPPRFERRMGLKALAL
jgi:hypothetical protein